MAARVNFPRDWHASGERIAAARRSGSGIIQARERRSKKAHKRESCVGFMFGFRSQARLFGHLTANQFDELFVRLEAAELLDELLHRIDVVHG